MLDSCAPSYHSNNINFPFGQKIAQAHYSVHVVVDCGCGLHIDAVVVAVASQLFLLL